MVKSSDNWQQGGIADTQQPAPDSSFSSALRAELRYLWPMRRTFALVVGCILLAIAADLFQPYLLKVLIDDDLTVRGTGASLRMLLAFTAIYLGLSTAGFLFTYLQNNLLQFAGQSIVANIRKHLFERMSGQSVSFFDRHPRGSLITHLSSDTETVSQFFSQVLLSLLRDGLSLVFIVVMMFRLDATVTLDCLLLLPIIAGIAFSFRSYMRTTYRRARLQLSRLISFTAENLAGMSLVQAYRQEPEQLARFDELNRNYYRANLREIRTNVLFNRSFDLLGNLSVAAVVWAGGRAVLGHDLAFGVLYAFITYIRMFFQPISTISSQWNTLQSATVSMNRIRSLLAEEPEVADRAGGNAGGAELPPPGGAIVFRDVSFGYVPDVPVLRRLNLSIAPGERVGIVGTTGAGKSSLIGLLCRFYDVGHGSVSIDGTDVRDVPQRVLQRWIGLVQQEPFLYSGSVRDNVRLFDETIGDERVEEACRLVGADAFIRRMKDGYDARLSETGSGLSAGERQLLSFARIVVYEPRILVLDEATANMDSASERQIQRALDIVSRQRTTIVVAHRLSTVANADRILVMHQGEVAEEGTHEQLLALGGYYERLYRHSRGHRPA